ncbi:MAG: type I 3-dehydroquinate dehydratase [Desulfurococcales archaeon]|nr:type I 3-dehydroquinate dehydratase [Desulfurococcales archaeon]
MGEEGVLHRIAAVVAGPSIDSIVEAALETPAGIVELRLDTVEDDLEAVIERVGRAILRLRGTGKRVIVTIRDSVEGGGFEGPPWVKEGILRGLAVYRPDYIDVELRNPLAGRITGSLLEQGIGVIASFHELEGPMGLGEIERVLGSVRRLARSERVPRGGLIAKVVYRCRDPLDGIPSMLAVAREGGGLVSFGLGGECGYTRLLAPLLGAPFTYAHASGKPLAPGQYSVSEVLELWRRLGVAWATTS